MAKIAVLGCGPAGLIAAHAAVTTGHVVDVFSKRRKSEMFGAQYLHAPIPGMTEKPPVAVNFEHVGSYDDYRRKVYGNVDVEAVTGVKVSAEEFIGAHQGWDIRQTYDALWERYLPSIIDVERIGPRWVGEVADSMEYEAIISTIPAPALCWDMIIEGITPGRGHYFSGQRVYVLGDAPERGQFASDFMQVPRNTIICNGEQSPSWYRASNVFGYTSIEWPFSSKPPLSNVAEVGKPLTTNCDCHPNVWKLGRYGQWKKGVLVNHVWDASLLLLSQVSV